MPPQTNAATYTYWSLPLESERLRQDYQTAAMEMQWSKQDELRLRYIDEELTRLKALTTRLEDPGGTGGYTVAELQTEKKNQGDYEIRRKETYLKAREAHIDRWTNQSLALSLGKLSNELYVDLAATHGTDRWETNAAATITENINKAAAADALKGVSDVEAQSQVWNAGVHYVDVIMAGLRAHGSSVTRGEVAAAVADTYLFKQYNLSGGLLTTEQLNKGKKHDFDIYVTGATPPEWSTLQMLEHAAKPDAELTKEDLAARNTKLYEARFKVAELEERREELLREPMAEDVQARAYEIHTGARAPRSAMDRVIDGMSDTEKIQMGAMLDAQSQRKAGVDPTKEDTKARKLGAQMWSNQQIGTLGKDDVVGLAGEAAQGDPDLRHDIVVAYYGWQLQGGSATKLASTAASKKADEGTPVAPPPEPGAKTPPPTQATFKTLPPSMEAQVAGDVLGGGALTKEELEEQREELIGVRQWEAEQYAGRLTGDQLAGVEQYGMRVKGAEGQPGMVLPRHPDLVPGDPDERWLGAGAVFPPGVGPIATGDLEAAPVVRGGGVGAGGERRVTPQGIVGGLTPASPDPRDLRAEYNTPIPDNLRLEYRAWLKRMSVEKDRDISADQVDYDVQGMFLEEYYGGQRLSEPGPQGHGTDLYKKPTHPTFSAGSVYAKKGQEGGKFVTQGGKAFFIAGKTNREHWTEQELQDYFRKHEPGVELVYREQAPQPAAQGGGGITIIQGAPQSQESVVAEQVLGAGSTRQEAYEGGGGLQEFFYE